MNEIWNAKKLLIGIDIFIFNNLENKNNSVTAPIKPTMRKRIFIYIKIYEERWFR